MPPQAPSVGTLTRFAADLTNPPGNAFEYKSFNFGKKGKVVSTDGIRGTRSHPVERTRQGEYAISGQIAMQPGPTELAFWLPLMTGGVPTGTPTVTYPLAETVPYFYVAIDRIAQQFTWSGCKISKATFKSGQGQFLDLTVNVEALTEAQGAVTGLTSLMPQLDSPYYFTDATLQYNGVSYQFREVEIMIDNHLKVDRFMNSVTRTDLPELDRTVSVSLTMPYTTDEITIYDQNATAAAVSVNFTNGTFLLSFTLPSVQFPTQAPTTPGREEILLPLHGTARAILNTPPTPSIPEITIANKAA